MEALTGASVAALTIYDMAKAIDKQMTFTRRAGREGEGMNGRRPTVSDRVSRGEADDASGDLLEELLRADGYDVERRVVPDEADEIAAAIEELAAAAELVLTTGGTGLAPRDVTPEATRTVLQREAPGIAEALRADSIAKTPHGLLSRGVAGVVGRALVVNLPGSTGGCRDGYAVLRPALGHARRAARRPADRAPADIRPDMRVARLYYRLVKFEHTIFALPFAYVGAFLAVGGVPSAHDLLWITRRDGRRPVARDGAEPADRRADRRGEPAHRGAGASVGRAQRPRR